ncbi:unnamed protein product, partial [Urochloa humidicola]
WRKTISILHPLRSVDPSLHAEAGAGRAARALGPRLRGQDHDDQASMVVRSVGVPKPQRQGEPRWGEHRPHSAGMGLGGQMQAAARAGGAAGCRDLICPARRHGGADGQRQMLLHGLW